VSQSGTEIQSVRTLKIACQFPILSHLETLERFQSKVFRILTDAPWYVPNAVIRRDLQVPTVRQEVRN
jgi:hypothetical protein